MLIGHILRCILNYACACLTLPPKLRKKRFCHMLQKIQFDNQIIQIEHKLKRTAIVKIILTRSLSDHDLLKHGLDFKFSC